MLVRTLEDWRGRNYGPASFRADNRIQYTPTAVREWMDGQSSASAPSDGGPSSSAPR
ncbi:hypothetical protein [Microbacterium sp. MM2322]|uniref:hypothetical protein n=1 Tax=Microbacterium sp. MM2322 TaxID=3157631 RepID=UPI003D8061AB